TVLVCLRGVRYEGLLYLLLGWLDLAASLLQTVSASTVPGRSPGIQGGDQCNAGAVWVPRDCDGQCRHQIGHQPVSRRSIRIRAERNPERARRLLPQAGHVEAESVRRRDRRSDQEG